VVRNPRLPRPPLNNPPFTTLNQEGWSTCVPALFHLTHGLRRWRGSKRIFGNTEPSLVRLALVGPGLVSQRCDSIRPREINDLRFLVWISKRIGLARSSHDQGTRPKWPDPGWNRNPSSDFPAVNGSSDLFTSNERKLYTIEHWTGNGTIDIS
jgi:hypothetical protein